MLLGPFPIPHGIEIFFLWCLAAVFDEKLRPIVPSQLNIPLSGALSPDRIRSPVRRGGGFSGRNPDLPPPIGFELSGDQATPIGFELSGDQATAIGFELSAPLCLCHQM